MVLKDNWETLTFEEHEGRLILIERREDLEEFFYSKKFPYQIQIDLGYKADADGFPEKEDADRIAAVTEALQRPMEKDKLAILVYQTIGEGLKSWHWVARHLPSFQERLNKALAEFPLLPLEIEVVEDLSWQEYWDLKEL